MLIKRYCSTGTQKKAISLKHQLKELVEDSPYIFNNLVEPKNL